MIPSFKNNFKVGRLMIVDEALAPPNRATLLFLAMILILAALGLILFWAEQAVTAFNAPLFSTALLIGILAQAVDGALGMAYGVTATTFLLTIGVAPATATASVHIAEIFTTGASGLSHWRLGNINKPLFKWLLIPGMIGAVAGVFLVTSIDGKALRPWIASYLLVMGGYIILKAFRRIAFRNSISGAKVVPLAFFGALLDSLGGGGWGPVVNTTLVGSGQEPKRTIGTVNAAEFFITVVSGFSFAMLIGITYWETIAGLIVGGLFAAPIAAKLTRALPTKVLMIFVGVLIVCLSAINIYKALA
jgi:uncharacterized protein